MPLNFTAVKSIWLEHLCGQSGQMKTQDCWLERLLLASCRKEKEKPASSRITPKAMWPKGPRLGGRRPGFRFWSCPCDFSGVLRL